MNTICFESQRIVPAKIVCVGRNYAEHIAELHNEVPDQPVLFMKPNSAISDRLRQPATQCRYEGEISFLMQNGRIAGVGFGLDLTLVEVQNQLKTKGLPWERAKAFDGSALFSDFVKAPPCSALRLELWINDELRQSGSVGLMIYKPDQLLGAITACFSLTENDIVMTGTPQGTGAVIRGDCFEGRIYQGNELLVMKQWVVE